MSSKVAVATWDLTPTQSKAAESFLDTSPTLTSSKGESAFEDDTRKLVDEADRQPGGKYYSIVKLQLKYEGQPKDDPSYAMGTGWLIKDDLLVTAGHCAFDHQYGYGKAIEVKAYVGYYGRDSIEKDKTNVQFRHGVAIATTKGWINSDANRANDVSFIRVNRPFDNVIPFKWEATPVTAYSVDLGVVGYPADRTKNNTERGAEMYEMFLKTNFDLNSTPSNMLEYRISTYAGQSGSPVLRRDKTMLRPIAAHVYGLGDRNSASVIRGQFGNDYGAYTDALDPKNRFETITTTSANIKYLSVPSRVPEAGLEPHTESFSEILKKVLDVGAKVAPVMLQAGSPFLGPQANKIASAVSTAIIAANEIKKAVTGSGTESDFETIPYKSYASRAVLAEATLQYVLNGPYKGNNVKIFEAMKKSIEGNLTTNKVQVKAFAKTFGPGLLEPALRIAVADAAPKTSAEAALLDAYPRIGSKATVHQLKDPSKKAFVEKLNSQRIAKNAPEGFLDFLCPLASFAIKGVGAVVKAVAGESASDPPATPSDTMQAHVEVLCHRALMAEAALQAALEIPVEQHEEGFWDSLVSTVKDIGGTVMKVAPSVIKVVAPIVKSLAESGRDDGETESQSLSDILRNGGSVTNGAVSPLSISDFVGNGETNRILAVSATGTKSLEPQHDGLFFEPTTSDVSD